MKANQLFRLFGFPSFAAALAVFGSGCATQQEHSFNDDFNQTLPTAPRYFVEDGGESRFYVGAHQGNPSNGQERVFDAKRAVAVVAETEAKRRGWENWTVDYIEERNQGWMHLVKAEVNRDKTIENKAKPAP